jgi:hypothetical protein
MAKQLAEKKKRGRPTLPADEGKRFPLNMRTTKELRDRLESAAARTGRSLAQEVESRLEASFLTEDVKWEEFGGSEKHQIFRLMSAAAETIESRKSRPWLTDEIAAIAVNAAWIILASQLLPIPVLKEVRKDFEDATPTPLIPDVPEHPELPDIMAKPLPVKLSNDDKSKIANYNAAVADYQKKVARREAALAEERDAIGRRQQMFDEWYEGASNAENEGVQIAQSLFPPRR